MPHHPPHGPGRKRRPDETPMSTRLAMVAVGLCILGLLYYFFGENPFPKDITYKNVPAGGSTYVIRRENP